MTLFPLLAALALVPVILITFATLLSGGRLGLQAWKIAALFCAAFSVWSLAAVVKGGPTGFWPVHTQTIWGTQVWFDLLMALTMAWVLIVPRAKQLNMKLLIWLIFILCSGSIGFSAMLARLLYLENRRA